MVDYLPSKQEIWVRFPLSAKILKREKNTKKMFSLGRGLRPEHTA